MTVLRRAGQYALVLWAAVTLNFALPHLAPGDPVNYLYGGDQQSLDPKYIAQMRADYGLDRPILEQYVSFWSGLVHGDLGMSVQHNRPVLDVLWEKLPWTIALVGIGTLLAFVIGSLLGAWAAWRRGSAKETGTVVTVLAIDSMPGFWIGMILIAVFSVTLGWFPSYGAASFDATGFEWLAEVASRMALPVATLTIAGIGGFFLMTRASMVGVLDEPFIRLARAKGLGEFRVAVGHALRNALLPVYTTLTLTVGVLLSGAVVVESVFAYPGLGKLTFDAVTARDYPLLQGAFLLATVGIIAANLLADLTYPLLDPRVRKDRTAAKRHDARSPEGIPA
ncbi:ABC transporter permease [Rhodococcus sp. HNM0563]|uniref:ABC transporter permease n=1 Tax=unclassified Rhodococcus (in: high G+C Gram-positive bacteria) TaxID=192944 RepID=UPI00146F51E1|nr:MULTISPECIES: ABC transporter permease [unclassified Rhodococcus (in: high G+C Gram-positive bacteria)]MCK0093382.1 ABC transporter permease [Rhodococcus sp. F64268]NLU60783.1 ABC transporter permease [Rhodococcus sp. HNM0563]